MSVYKRGEFWHFDFTLPGGARRRGSTKQRSKTAALKEEERQRRAELGETPRQVPTLSAAADRWFSAKVEGKKSAATTAMRIEIALRLVGDRLVTEIDTPEIEDAMQRRRLEPTRQGKLPTNGTVNRDLIDTTLRPILRYCRRNMKVPSLPDVDWKELRLAEPKGRARTFTLSEMTTWRGALPEHHRPVFDFIATYGVRLREAFFPLDSFDPETGMIVIRSRKNGLPHAIRLQADQVRDMAARLGRAREAGIDTVWFREGKRGLVAITWRGFQSASRTALEATSTADARPVHDLRHHAATAFLRLPGATLAHVQKLLGHEWASSTARYAHVSSDDVFNIMRRAGDTKALEDETQDKENNTLDPKRTGT